MTLGKLRGEEYTSALHKEAMAHVGFDEGSAPDTHFVLCSNTPSTTSSMFQ